MRRLNKEKIIERLDEIEAFTSMPGKDGDAIGMGLPGIDGEALDLMVKVARRKDGVKLLVERYAASRSVIIVGALGFILTERAKTTKLKDAYLLFEAIEKLNRGDNLRVLGMPLTALKFQIGIAEVWQQMPMPKSLYPYLQDCLEISGELVTLTDRGLSAGIQLDAIDVLLLMCEKRIYNLNFDEEQRKWLENKIRKIADDNPGSQSFQRDTSYFFDCLNKQSQKE